MERANSRRSIRFHLTRLFGRRPYALWKNGSGHRHLGPLNQLNQPDQREGFGQEMELFAIVETGLDFCPTNRTAPAGWSRSAGPVGVVSDGERLDDGSAEARSFASLNP